MTLVAFLDTDRGPLILADMLASGLEKQGSHPLITPVSFLQNAKPLSSSFSGGPTRKLFQPNHNVLIGFAGEVDFGRRIINYFTHVASLLSDPTYDEFAPHADWIVGESNGNSYLIMHCDNQDRTLSIWNKGGIPISYGDLQGLAIGSGAPDLQLYMSDQYNSMIKKEERPFSGLEIIFNCVSNFIAAERIAGNGLAEDQRYGGGFEIYAFDGTGFKPVEEIAYVVGILRLGAEGIQWVRGLTTVTYYEQSCPVTVSTSAATNLVFGIPDACGRKVNVDERIISPSIVVTKFTTDESIGNTTTKKTISSRMIYDKRSFKPNQFEIEIDSNLNVSRFIDKGFGHRIIRDAANALGINPNVPIAPHDVSRRA